MGQYDRKAMGSMFEKRWAALSNGYRQYRYVRELRKEDRDRVAPPGIPN